MLKIAADIETKRGHITCIGFAWSKTEAICIPFTCKENPAGYWTLDEEVAIVRKICELLTHPKVAVTGQNWHYDAQYIARHWGIVVQPKWLDTMLAQHIIFAGMPKTLDFIASMYCDFYRYWKDDGKEANEKLNDEQGWVYNCDDNCYTYECATVLDPMLDKTNLRAQYDQLMRKWMPALRTMLRGTKINMATKQAYAKKLMEAMREMEQWFEDVLGHSLNPRSPKQMPTLFFNDLLQKRVKGTSCDKDVLVAIGEAEPILKPLVDNIALYRTMGVFLSTFVLAPLDWDNRLRCMYGLGGTETYRLNSKEDVFGFGTNLQNIPRNQED